MSHWNFNIIMNLLCIEYKLDDFQDMQNWRYQILFNVKLLVLKQNYLII